MNLSMEKVVIITCRNLVYFDILDSQLSKIYWNARSSSSGILISLLLVFLFDAAAAIWYKIASELGEGYTIIKLLFI